jgi:CubicO group peptidase (beta-lactamase class C family)
MCPDQLDLAMEHAFQEGNDTGAVVILRHGNIVAERYAADRTSTDLATSWSVAKSFTSALVGAALADDNIQNLDESASNYITEWENTDKVEELRKAAGL